MRFVQWRTLGEEMDLNVLRLSFYAILARLLVRRKDRVCSEK